MPRITESIYHWNFGAKWHINEATKYVRSIEDSVTALHYLITPKEINHWGWAHATSTKQELAVARFVYEQKVKNPVVVLGNPEQPPLRYYPNHYNAKRNESAALRAICHLKRHWLLLKHYHKCYPDYELDRNYGYLNIDTLPMVLSKPMIDNFTIYDSLRKVPRIYLSGLRSLNEDYILRDPALFQEPLWWDEISKGAPFFTSEQQQEYDYLVHGQMPPEFFEWVFEPNKESIRRANQRYRRRAKCLPHSKNK